MAKTEFATGDALAVKAWAEKLHRDVEKETYFAKLTGTSTESLVHKKTELESKAGDKVTFGLRKKLVGAGVTSGQKLEGNEEKLTTYSSYVELEEYAHAVSHGGVMDRQRVMFSIDDEARDALKVWGAEKVDKLHFDALLSSPSMIFYRTSAAGAFSRTTSAATAKAAMHATNGVISLDFLTALRTWAKTGGNREYIPIRPIRVEGGLYHVLLCPPDVLYGLKTLSEFKQVRREAEVRGKDNPLFKDAVAVWDNIVIHEHENMPCANDGGGAAVRYGKCVFMGAQALTVAYGKRGKVVQEDADYQRETNSAWNIVMGVKKPTFNSKDYGSLGVYIACSNISDVAAV